MTDAVRLVQSAVLLDYRQYATLFPDAEIRRERVCGFTKSLMAVRSQIVLDCSVDTSISA